MVFYKTDKKFFVHDSVYLTNDDITSTDIIDWKTQPKVQVILSEVGREKFAEFTKMNVGKNAAMIVDKKLVSAPRINAQITKGVLLIVGFFDQEEAKKLEANTMTYVLLKEDFFDFEGYDYVYFPCEKPWHRLTKTKKGVVADMFGEHTEEELKELFGDSYINDMTLKNSQLVSAKELQTINHIKFGGRYGTWNHRIKTEEVIADAQKNRMG